jgi:integrase
VRLRWTDLNLTRGTMTVERSYAETRTGSYEKPTKTRQKRRIGLDPHIVDLLLAYRTECESDCVALGIELPHDAFVFSNSPDGSAPLLPSTVTQKCRRLATRAGLRSTRIHALRHYSATELLTAGVDLRTAAGRLGHGSRGATTLRFYSAWVEKVDRAAAGTIADLIPRPDPTRRTPRNPYEELAAVLRAAIERGELAPGSPLPTVQELIAQHAVSAGTVSRAVALLKQAGLVEASRGKRATVIASNRPS